MDLFISKKQAGRELCISNTSVKNLCDLQRLGTNSRGKVSQAEVTRLAEQQRIRLITNREWPKNDLDELAFICPATNPELGSNLELVTMDNLAQLATDELQRSGREDLLDGPGRMLSGAWRMSESSARRLVDEQGLILGAASKYVFEVVRVVDHVMNTLKGNNKVFIVEPVDDSVKSRYLGYVDFMNQNAREVLGIQLAE